MYNMLVPILQIAPMLPTLSDLYVDPPDNYVGLMQFDTTPLRLFRGGCTAEGGHEDDCLSACVNVSQVFTSIATFHNCVVIDMIATDPSTFDVANMSIAREFNIAAAASGSSSGESTITCFSGVCNATEGCQREGSLCSPGNLYEDKDGSRILADPLPCLAELCASALGKLDLDLAGPGVIISYFTQLSTAMIGVTITALLYLVHLHGQAKQSTPKSPFQLMVLTSFQEFHKSQCYFSMAIIGAFIYNTFNNERWEQMGREVLLNFSFMRTLSITSMLSISSAYFILQWWYPFSLYTSAITYAPWSLSAYAWRESSYLIKYKMDTLIFPETYDFCGRADPTVFCPVIQKPSDVFSLTPFGTPLEFAGLTAVCAFAFLSLVRDLVRGTKQFKQTRRQAKVVEEDIYAISRWISSIWLLKKYPSFWKGSIMVTIWALSMTVAGYQLRDLTVIDKKWVNKRNWGIGQTIALAAWFPFIGEVVHLLVCFLSTIIRKIPRILRGPGSDDSNATYIEEATSSLSSRPQQTTDDLGAGFAHRLPTGYYVAYGREAEIHGKEPTNRWHRASTFDLSDPSHKAPEQRILLSRTFS